ARRRRSAPALSEDSTKRHTPRPTGDMADRRKTENAASRASVFNEKINRPGSLHRGARGFHDGCPAGTFGLDIAFQFLWRACAYRDAIGQEFFLDGRIVQHLVQ